MWIFKDKLLGVLYLAAQEWNSGFDNSDYQAILYGLTETNADNDLFFAHSFYNPEGKSLTLLLARDAEYGDTGIIVIKSKEEDKAAAEVLDRIDKIESCFTSWTLNNQSYWE